MQNSLKRILLILFIAGLVSGYLAGWPWNTDMVQQPSLATYARPRPPAEGTLPVDGELPLERWQMEELLHNPRPASAAPSEQGRFYFSVYCLPCHGPGGRGDGPVAKVFVQPRNLTGPEVQGHADGWIYGTIRNGANMMPRYGPELSSHQRWEIVAFVRSLKASSP